MLGRRDHRAFWTAAYRVDVDYTRVHAKVNSAGVPDSIITFQVVPEHVNGYIEVKDLPPEAQAFYRECREVFSEDLK